MKEKYDFIGREIKRKTHNLTWNSAQNDPINFRIKGFSFHDFEDEFRHSRWDFSLFSERNLTFKHFLDTKINQEEEERKRFKEWDI